LALTRQEKLDAQAIFAAGKACSDCGGIHKRACPRVKRKAFHPNGNVIEVEYRDKFDDSAIIWPEDAFDPDSEGADGR
jgi:hypothetical protein